jgi:hypothetical protein
VSFALELRDRSRARAIVSGCPTRCAWRREEADIIAADICWSLPTVPVDAPGATRADLDATAKLVEDLDRPSQAVIPALAVSELQPLVTFAETSPAPHPIANAPSVVPVSGQPWFVIGEPRVRRRFRRP